MDNNPKNYLLTERETEVLKYILKGYTNKEIAKTLYISIDTVKAHVSSILFKMKVEDRLGIVLKLFDIDIKDFIKSLEE